MYFSDALSRMQMGGKTVTRAAWPIEQCLKIEGNEFLFINAPEPGPTLTHEDILATDWDLVFKE